MISLEVLALAAALVSAPDVVLLDFSAQWCGPCRQMEPTVHRLAQEGYPVRQVDVDQQSQLASQYRVRALPCFIMVADGREVERLEGATSQETLLAMFRRVGYTPPGASPRGVVETVPQSQSAPPRPPVNPALDAPPATGGPGTDVAQRALNASVRLKIEDASGHSYGTGTIIDTHGQEALVLTCGHVFRDSQGEGVIHVTMFAPEATQPVEGHLVHYDLKRDVGLISIRPGIAIEPIRVAPRAQRVRPGDSVFSVGCDHGDDASVRFSKVTAIDKYLGSPNIEVAGQPVDGRSGGGLFSAEGMLIGVCNAADPADDEGIYAALATVQQQLDEIGQTQIYDAAATASLTDSPTPIIEMPGLLDQPSQPPPLSPEPPSHTAPGIARQEAPSGFDLEDSEIIVIIRPRNDPTGRPRMVVLEDLPLELQNQLKAAYLGADGSQTPMLSSNQPASPAVIRGQSRR